MTAEELTELIDKAYFAVDKSMVGPLRLTATDALGERLYNNMAFQVFLAVVAQMTPKGLSPVSHHNADVKREPWEEG